MKKIFFLIFLSVCLLTVASCGENESITINFQTNGGSSIEAITLQDFVMSNLPQTTKEGYLFDGWYLNEDLTSPLTTNTIITSSVTLFAKWVQIETLQLTITFETNGGEDITSLIINDGETPILPIPEKEGHRFLGWFMDADHTVPFDDLPNITEDITVFAKWETQNYQIAFETNEGSIIPPIEKFYGQTINNIPLPEKSGHDFAGWYLDASLTTPLNLNTMPAHDITLYAKWVTAMITISFDTNGGSWIDEVIGYPNEVFIEPLDPIKAGYIFTGWFLSLDAIELYQFDFIPSESLTLYADWATQNLTYVYMEETDSYEVSIGDAIDATDVFIPKYHQGKQVTHVMSFGFQYGGDMESIHLPNTITHINQMGFAYAHALKSIHLPNSLTYIGSAAFRFCYSLESITVDEEHLYFKSIDGILFSKDNLTLIRYPQAKSDTFYQIPNSVETIAEDAFSSANHLTSLDIGTGVKTIKSHAFFRTSSIISIVIPDQVVTIELYAFRQSYALSSVTLGAGLTEISSYMFEGCTSLQTIIIPHNINSIGYGAFYDCTQLREVYILRTTLTNPITGGIFMFTNTHFSFKIYFADASSLNYYKTAPNWLSYASKMYLGSPQS